MLGDKSDVTEDDLKEMVYLEQVHIDIYTCTLVLVVVAQLFR